MYTEEQIKTAFWKTFFAAGELWFPNRIHTEEDKHYANNEVESVWAEFTEHLKAPIRPIPDPTSNDLGAVYE